MGRNFLSELEEAILTDDISQIGSLLCYRHKIKKMQTLISGTKYEIIEDFLQSTVFPKPKNPEAFEFEFGVKHNLHPLLSEKDTLCLLINHQLMNLINYYDTSDIDEYVDASFVDHYRDFPQIIERITDEETKKEHQKVYEFSKDLITVEELQEFKEKYNISREEEVEFWDLED
jgi:hypothetical protein